ncbi:MAG: alcohol dehydrogenase catalytic domain-containing protein [Thermodesulfobacteriota bacterium]
MRAVVMKARGELAVEEVAVPRPQAGEALVEVERCGVCGSDLITLAGGKRISLPRILGHEFAGVIREVAGGKHYPFLPGDRVVAEPITGCGVCRSCRAGHYNVCNDRVILGVETDGAFARYVRVPLHNIVPVPDGVPVEEAALVQPVAVVVHAVRRTRFQAGCNVAMLGAGPIGALLAIVSRAGGATKVVISEPSVYRRALMEKIGFITVDPAVGDTAAAARSALAPGDEGFDVVFDAAGTQGTPTQAAEMVRAGGQVVLVAAYRNEPVLNIALARKREIDYITSRAHNMDDFRASMALIASRQVDVRPLVTEQIGLDRFPEAFRALASGTLMKVLGVP